MPLSATTVPYLDDGVGNLGRVGPAIVQTFLPDGTSVVRTDDGASCVVSTRIQIENSSYIDADGTVLDFDTIRRSPATSLQAIAPEGGDIRFRIQLKYSPRADRPIRMTFGDVEWDLSDALEKSTDSLSITGERAVILAQAFRNGLRPQLVAVSRDNDHVVTDRVEVPDLAALTTCQAALAPDESQVPSTQISMRFDADPETTPLATLGDLRECRMEEPPGELYLAKIQQTTGFFSQTDKVFVAFDENGNVVRAYVPGIFDADLRDGRHDVRVSIAANSNVPMDPNDVKGCLGMSPVQICSFDMDNAHYLGDCPETMAMLSTSNGPDPLYGYIGTRSPGTGSSSGGVTSVYSPGTGTGGGGDGGTGITVFEWPPTTTPGDPGDPGDPTIDPPPPPPPAVPLPPTAFLLLGALGVGAGLRRRKAH